MIASTASPFKFNQSVLIALEGLASVAGKNEFELLDLLSPEEQYADTEVARRAENKAAPV